jgi:hypothetical protein
MIPMFTSPGAIACILLMSFGAADCHFGHSSTKVAVDAIRELHSTEISYFRARHCFASRADLIAQCSVTSECSRTLKDATNVGFTVDAQADCNKYSILLALPVSRGPDRISFYSDETLVVRWRHGVAPADSKSAILASRLIVSDYTTNRRSDGQ